MENSRPKFVGSCIFCGGVGVTDDHIIPLALGGVDKLEKSSCEPCRDKLNRSIDAPVINGPLLGAARMIFNRPRSKRRPPRSHVKQVRVAGGAYNPGDKMEASVENLKVSELPRIMMLYTTGLPALLTGEQLTDDHKITKIFYYNGNFGPAENEHTVLIGSTEQYEDFLRMVAKIGHAAAYLLLNKIDYEEFIPAALFDKSINIRRFVGEGPKLKKTEKLNRISLREQGQFVIVSVQIFADLGMPNFDVVVGRRQGWAIFV